MPTITIPDETYQRLTSRASELGTTVEALVTPALERVMQGPAPTGTPPTPPGDLPYDEWKKRFDSHMLAVQARAHHYPPGHVTDVSRESIYERCGE
jgi:hypothetical protein